MCGEHPKVNDQQGLFLSHRTGGIFYCAVQLPEEFLANISGDCYFFDEFMIIRYDDSDV